MEKEDGWSNRERWLLQQLDRKFREQELVIQRMLQRALGDSESDSSEVNAVEEALCGHENASAQLSQETEKPETKVIPRLDMRGPGETTRKPDKT